MEIHAASVTEKASLGQGYNSENEDFVGQCVRLVGDAEFVGNQTASISFDRSLDESRMATEMGFQLDARARYGLFSGSLAANFASSSSSSEYSDVTIYSHTVNFKNAKFRFAGLEDGLTSEGKSAKGNSNGPFVGDNWGGTCGDQFVSQIQLGAKLLVSVKVEFASREEKQSFSADIGFHGPPVDVEAHLKIASARFGKHASLSIHAFQLGGDVGRLSQIFNTGKGQSALITASLEDPKSITELLRAVVDYSTNDFPTQIKETIPLTSPIGPAHLIYITSPYQELGLLATPPIISAGVTNARRELSSAFERNAKYQSRISSMLNGPVRLSPRQLAQTKQMQISVAKNLALIQEAAFICYTDLSKAVAKVTEITERLVDFTPEQFDIRPESFAQWWDTKDLPDTLRSDKSAIDELADFFKPQFNNFDAIPDKGLALEKHLGDITVFQILNNPSPIPEFSNGINASLFRSPVWSVMRESAISDFSIAACDINDLSPLKSLPLLRKLWISDDVRIGDFNINSFAELKELVEFEITGPVETLEPISTLTKLTSIKIFQNNAKIHDLLPLANLRHLQNLRIDSASIEDISTLDRLLELQHVTLMGSPIHSIAPLMQLENLISFQGGSTRAHPIEDIDLLLEHPRFSNILIQNVSYITKENPDRGYTWIRRGRSNMFDTATISPTGQHVSGVGAITGVNLGTPSPMSITLSHERDGLIVDYFINLGMGGQSISSGWWMTEKGDSGELIFQLV